ncbi:uncharacterized protein MYCFIDRAFT_171886 [Pseudocercospora fijiensis CIRAD86]|uniref:Uncharacterized protein n=1 Tax=Pseudocercospora fijiensis (strain CIRAD86) TaxID=383855 RepID=M3AN96_PSEFD|nr:uncharacterized protein MYCFIDRAFT_171886 [Pseudocercospora fijiensis CIRAD86]EME86081.1 hypothetical protein MYCFIDRAFT_171886 [Pseudocercospora fijiensis CIRAD86]
MGATILEGLFMDFTKLQMLPPNITRSGQEKQRAASKAAAVKSSGSWQPAGGRIHAPLTCGDHI